MFLSFLCTPGTPSDPQHLAREYRAINKERPQLAAPPADPHIMDKLIWPLRNAKASFVVGNYLGTIALCGTVAEMVAILVYELHDPQMRAVSMSHGDQKALFGRRFERLDQRRRIQVLGVFGMMNDEDRERLNLVRDVRNKYLHFWSEGHDSLRADAIKVYLATVSLVASAIGYGIDASGRIRLRPGMIRYLERRGQTGPAGSG